MPQPPPNLFKRFGFSTLAIAEQVVRPGRRPSFEQLKTVRNFIFLQFERPLGTVVHATPVFRALREALPDAYIAVAAAARAGEILRMDPCIDRCETVPELSNFLAATSAVRSLVHSMPPGPVCLMTTIGNRSPRIGMLALAAGPCWRAGFTMAPRLYDLPLTFRPPRAQIAGNLDLLRSFDYPVESREPRICYTASDERAAADMLSAIPREGIVHRIAFITHNSGDQANRWPLDRFRQVIDNLSARVPMQAVFVGSASEVDAVQQLYENCRAQRVNLAGKTSVPVLAAVFAQCDLVIGLDTGPFHVARAVGLPGVVVAPAWQDPAEWLPIGNPRYRILRGPSIASPPEGYCMAEISVAQVVSAALELLANTPNLRGDSVNAPA